MAPIRAESLQSSLQGQVLAPGDPGYDSARKVWNGHIDRHPALIARCSGPADVTAAVRFAREHDLLAAVRGGGHSVAGHAVCDDGIVIDLSPMTGARVDPLAPPSGSRAAASTNTSTARARCSAWRQPADS